MKTYQRIKRWISNILIVSMLVSSIEFPVYAADNDILDDGFELVSGKLVNVIDSLDSGKSVDVVITSVELIIFDTFFVHLLAYP